MLVDTPIKSAFKRLHEETYDSIDARARKVTFANSDDATVVGAGAGVEPAGVVGAGAGGIGVKPAGVVGAGSAGLQAYFE